MRFNELIGYYTYRSFLNKVDGQPDDLLWGQGELLILISEDGNISGTLSFPHDPMSENKEIMDISGRITSWAKLSMRFIGKGRDKSSISEFEYEYDCQMSNEWDYAEPKQVVSLVGTVRRNKDHGQAKAGVTASFIAVKREFTEPKDVKGVALIPEALNMLAERNHRLRHTVWHTIRGQWNSPKMTDEDREKLKKLDWYLSDPPRNSDGSLNLKNGAGEDFLYMHRRMIKMVNNIYDKMGVERPKSWNELPSPDTPQFAYKEVPNPNNPDLITFSYDAENSGVMIPPPNKQFMEQLSNISFFDFNKTSRGFRGLMQNMSRNLRNSRVVSQLSLAAYGNLIEYTVHNWMHMRWASISRNPQTNQPEVRDAYDIDKKWDDVKYDYLGDFHSSHVNPIFWKLHGWVDDCIDFWYDVHSKAHPNEVKRKTHRGIEWFEKGNWVIKEDPFDWPGAGHHHHDPNEEKVLIEVMKLLEEVDSRESFKKSDERLTRSNLPTFARFENEIE